jgi:DNA-binding MarR family transcriptional regulator
MTEATDPETIMRTCRCLAVRRAARTVSRRYDEAFRGVGLTNGQFSLLVALAKDLPVGIGRFAEALAMDRTTLTAALKPLARDGLVESAPSATDRRARRLRLTPAGRAKLAEALPAWQAAQADVADSVSRSDRPTNLR